MRSKQRQFARWLSNAKIQEAGLYRKLAQKALASWKGETVYLAFDSSSLWNRFVIVRVALIYRGRALPLSWWVMEHASTSVAFEAYQHILKEAAAILPTGCRVILLADRRVDYGTVVTVSTVVLKHGYDLAYTTGTELVAP